MWSNVSPATANPVPRQEAALAYDAKTNQVVLFSGFANCCGPAGMPDDTWVWNGTTWQNVSPSVSPPGRTSAVMAYDPATGQLVLFGGCCTSNPKTGTTQFFNDTWVWDGRAWSNLTQVGGPSIRDDSSMAFDSTTGQLIMFGGYSGYNNGSVVALDDTWAWNGSMWTKLNPPVSPPPVYGGAMATDPVTGHPVLFGGDNANAALSNETWTWTGSSWQNITPLNSPSARFAPVMAADRGTGTLVLFGGHNSSNQVLGDTWVWYGHQWSQSTPAKSPPALAAPSMATDVQTNRVVLFGGGVSGQFQAATWEWVP